MVRWCQAHATRSPATSRTGQPSTRPSRDEMLDRLDGTRTASATSAPLTSSGPCTRWMSSLTTSGRMNGISASERQSAPTSGRRSISPRRSSITTARRVRRSRPPTDVTPEMRSYHEELFGPVAAVYRVADEEQAIRLANDTEYGPGGSVFAADLERARRVPIESTAAWCGSITPGGPGRSLSPTRQPFTGAGELHGAGRLLSPTEQTTRRLGRAGRGGRSPDGALAGPGDR